MAYIPPGGAFEFDVTVTIVYLHVVPPLIWRWRD